MAEVHQPSVITSSIDEFGHTQVCDFINLVDLAKHTLENNPFNSTCSRSLFWWARHGVQKD